MSATSGAQVLRAQPGGLGRLLTPKSLVTILNTLILVVGELRYHILGSLDRLVVALVVCMLTDLVLGYMRDGKLRSVQSAYISGVSMTLLTRPLGGLLWPFALGSALAILSKYALTWRGRHLWNPTNFSISLLVLAAPSTVTILSHEFGNDLRVNAVIWAIGLLVVRRAKLLHVTGTYVLAFAAFAGLRSLITDGRWLVEVMPITGPMYQLFVFFMITDPPTTVSSRNGRIAVAVTIAAFECLLRLGNDFGLAWAAPFAPAPAIFALAIVGPIAKLIDIERKQRA